MGYCRPVHTDVMLIAEVQELFAGELGAVVGDDDIGDPKPMDDVGEEKDGLLGADVGDGRASIHLENLSMATNKWVYPLLPSVEVLLNRAPIPQTAR